MNEINDYKIEMNGLQKQIEMFSDMNDNTIEKGQLIHFESLRLENENLRKEIRILEESNNKLGKDLIEQSDAKMTLMTESSNKMQFQHEKKTYQHKYLYSVFIITVHIIYIQTFTIGPTYHQ